jgi:hypothetical protein
MNAAASIRLTVSIAFIATTVLACTSSTDAPTDDAEGAIGQVSQAAKCTTCGGDPDPEPEGPPDPPQPGPTIQCTGPYLKILSDGRCWHIEPGCHSYKAGPGVPPCPGFTVISPYGCPLATPVQRCVPLTGVCTCKAY